MQLVSGDLDELVGTRLSHEYRDFIVRRWPAILFRELLDGFVALPASLAVFSEKLIGDAANLKSSVPALRVAAILDFVTERPYLTGERIAIDLGEVRPALVNARCL